MGTQHNKTNIVMSFLRTALLAFVVLGTAVALSPVNVHKWNYNGKQHSASLYANEPTICDTVQQYSGYFQIDTSDKKYFYWFFESHQSPSTDPLVMWLTGGPGCSSVLALFTENGPCHVNAEGDNTTANPYSWNTMANLLYVDQPPGTGFSEGTYDHDEAGVAEDMYNFLQAFYAAFPKYNTTFYIFGESYAGHYVPAISHRVYLGNVNHNGPNIPLTGLGIGNGLTDPEVQYQYYAQMAYNSTSAPAVISASTYKSMTNAIPSCISAIKKCQTGSSTSCDIAYTLCNMAEVNPVTATGVNPYDLRVPCSYGNLCYNFTNIDAYLNRADVQAELGVSKQWESCNMDVNKLFEGDWMKNFQTQIPDLLGANIRVLIYAGDQDFICNWLGNKAWTLALDWAGSTAFNAASDAGWTVGSREAGKIRAAQGFTFLQVYGGGHMVPMDQPEAALAMLDGFLKNSL
eukprot:c25751_g1_i1.p1 GENE.c25751_g1_i1~~c25751_g1_i1.p1  ORF type:complete len:460 (-),score=109.61 c25751_g1_i1:52-1431(-)